MYKASDFANTTIAHNCYLRSLYSVTLCINASYLNKFMQKTEILILERL